MIPVRKSKDDLSVCKNSSSRFKSLTTYMMSVLHWLEVVHRIKEVNTFLENILSKSMKGIFTGGPENDTWGDIFLEAELISACCRRILSSASMSETFSSSLKIKKKK